MPYYEDPYTANAQAVGVFNWDVDRWHKISHESFFMGQAIREIKETYGDDVSVYRKAKSLAKFGRNTNNAAGTLFTVADFQGDEWNETFVSTNVIDSVVSTASDTQVITLEGHTIDGSGRLTFVVQDVTLTGTSPADLSTPLARANRAYVKNGTFASPATNLAGTVSVYDSSSSSGVTDGAPNTDSAVHLQVRGAAGKNQSEKCATSISSTDYWILTGLVCSAGRTGATANIDFEVEVRQVGGVWRPVGTEISMRNSVNPYISIDFEPHVLIRPNSDVRLAAISTVNDTPVSGRMRGVLAKVI